MTNGLSYKIVDVFTDRALAGNALCVVLGDVDGDEERMFAIARETNLSETTFVTRTGDASYDVRIWTTGGELPFAGHPSLGSAWALGPGRWTQTSPGATVVIEASESGAVMSQPDPVFTEVYPEDVTAGLGLPAASVPQAFVAEVGGTRHLLVPTDASIDRLDPDLRALGVSTTAVRATGVGVFRRVDDATLHARVFIPGVNVPEDPGTGSAAGPFGVLARRLWSTDEDVVIVQGAEMGRPCRIEVHAEEGNVRVGGRVAPCAEGRFAFGVGTAPTVGSPTL
ncbi:MAG TPA: PhzF family phenazine biosynthesis protein [Acidimicrobiales bacterium]|nr:PhzF family phenazine biosynthesis protein [Acidimicrobiales bacterium]